MVSCNATHRVILHHADPSDGPTQEVIRVAVCKIWDLPLGLRGWKCVLKSFLDGLVQVIWCVVPSQLIDELMRGRECAGEECICGDHGVRFEAEFYASHV